MIRATKPKFSLSLVSSTVLLLLLLLLAYAVDRSEQVPVPGSQQSGGDNAVKTKMCGTFNSWMDKMCTFFGESNSCLKNEVRLGEYPPLKGMGSE